LPEGAELLWMKRTLQFVGYFDQGHAWIIATPCPGITRHCLRAFIREAWLVVASSVLLYIFALSG
jgi:hypothetical protein